jgi:hypothetical protein
VPVLVSLVYVALWMKRAFFAAKPALQSSAVDPKN